jgi:hypothetical protein
LQTTRCSVSYVDEIEESRYPGARKMHFHTMMKFLVSSFQHPAFIFSNHCENGAAVQYLCFLPTMKWRGRAEIVFFTAS